MFIDTDRFGSIELKDTKVVRFPLGLPGFEDLREFVILEILESRPLYWLQSIENQHTCLPVIIPFEFIEDYFVRIRDCELEELSIEDKNDLFILNVVVIPEDIRQMTANLAAPIVINTKRGVGKQIIIDAKELPIRYPIYEIIMKKLKGGETDAGAVEEKR